MLLLFLCGVIVRSVGYDSKDALDVTHLLYVFSLMCYIVKVLAYMALSDRLGIKSNQTNMLVKSQSAKETNLICGPKLTKLLIELQIFFHLK